MEELLHTSVAEQRFHAVLLGSLASLAFLLALVGIYDVIAYTVRLRTQEMGVRLARVLCLPIFCSWLPAMDSGMHLPALPWTGPEH